MIVLILLGSIKSSTDVTVQYLTGFEEIMMITFSDVAIFTATGPVTNAPRGSILLVTGSNLNYPSTIKGNW